MGLNHSLGLYATLRALNPTLVVESGVCLDPSPEYRTHTAPDAYDFSDEFAGVDWTQFDRVYRRGGVSRRPTSCCFRRAV